MNIKEVLKDAALEAFNQSSLLAGTAEARERFGRGAGGDISTKLDLAAENAVLNTLKKHNFRPTIIGEECGKIEGAEGYLIMDAIDGTTNAITGFPFYCCSLAYATEYKMSSVIEAVVMDLVRGDLYQASKDKGALINGTKMQLSTEDVDESNILLGLNLSGMNSQMICKLGPLISMADHVRQFGANALELCYFARGFMDAYIDLRNKIRTTDIAAAFLIVKEAGGKLFDSNCRELDSDLNQRATISFLAVKNDMMLKRLISHIVR